jgi:hypothetical protein
MLAYEGLLKCKKWLSSVPPPLASAASSSPAAAEAAAGLVVVEHMWASAHSVFVLAPLSVAKSQCDIAQLLLIHPSTHIPVSCLQ